MLDVIRAADWVIDLGPGAGPEGGRVLYEGPPELLPGVEGSMTGRALADEACVRPGGRSGPGRKASPCISIRDAWAHNLKGINVDFPKGALTVVTGVSGSGKSSLVGDVLEAEARRRYLESLSIYERQATKEGPEAPVGAVTGLGVSVTIGPGSRMHARRATVGTATEIVHHLSSIMSVLGDRDCADCGREMLRDGDFTCPSCGTRVRMPEPGQFLSTTYAGACLKCHGVGTVTVPEPEKVIIRPERPICDGAMYSPGFFPKGYICKPYNGGYYQLQALAARYGFDPARTPWNEMAVQAQRAFLFGDPEPMRVEYLSRKGRTSSRTERFRGFYGWIGDWDFGGTYTSQAECPECGGGRIRPEFLSVKLLGLNMSGLSSMPLANLAGILSRLATPRNLDSLAGYALQTSLRRLEFLSRVGLGYLDLNRLCMTLSAGEAQRIRLAGLLGSGLTSITVLVDEPSRGLHPSEVGALTSVLKELAHQGNTVIVVEHDPVLIKGADHVVDLGPGPGALGGRIVARGSPEEVALADTPTGRWLRGEGTIRTRGKRREGRGHLVIRGARANNLRGQEVRIPLGTLVGICGVSGSGKSTLMIDTLARVLAPRKQTTSVAHEPIQPGVHDAIEGAPGRAIIVDQAKQGVTSPLDFLGLEDSLRAIYAGSEDAEALGIKKEMLARRCSACRGRGIVVSDMGFLPSVASECEVCEGTGLRSDAWDIRVHGISLPEAYSMTIDQVLEAFGEDGRLVRPLQAARDVGLGYLVLRQPGHALSGGEAQRLKIAKELCRKTSQETLYILDEPTVGQHMEDIERLVGVLHGLVDAGHTVAVIEHQPHLLASCDWLIELGPSGGPGGGQLVASGTPEDLAKGDTPSAAYIREALGG